MIDGHLNARDRLIARLYKQLRVEDETNPLQGESLKLYNEIKLALIGVTENVYKEKLEERMYNMFEKFRREVNERLHDEIYLLKLDFDDILEKLIHQENEE